MRQHTDRDIQSSATCRPTRVLLRPNTVATDSQTRLSRLDNSRSDTKKPLRPWSEKATAQSRRVKTANTPRVCIIFVTNVTKTKY